MVIRQLDPSIASRIAAGEVVERPASVVKELVENSIDAQASHITVDIHGRSTESIRVSDDGLGIPPDQLHQAFQRHSTSKLQAVEDLQSITTLGFRGEALPSIAAVSIMTCQSRTPEASSGHRVRYQWGEPDGPPQPAGCPQGTTFQVADLFGNTPVRRRFLRTNNTEVNHIQQAVTRYAMARPEIRFSFSTDGRRSLETPGSGSLRDALTAIYDPDTARNMLDVQFQLGEITVKGCTGTPDTVRSSRAEITTLVNGRWIRDRDLAWAVEQGYSRALPQHRHPVSTIIISLPPHLVDINCHPTKQEVRFRHPSVVFGAVRKAVEDALRLRGPIRQANTSRLRSHQWHDPWTSPAGSDHQGKTPDLLGKDTATDPEVPDTVLMDRNQHTGSGQEEEPENSFGREEMPDRTAGRTGPRQSPDDTGTTGPARSQKDQAGPRPAPQLWRQLDQPAPGQDLAPAPSLSLTLAEMRVLGQSAQTYIVTDHPEGICLIDQHAAHERVLYDRIKTVAAEDRAESQAMMIPANIRLSPAQSDLAQEHLRLLLQYGFKLSQDEQTAWTIQAVPATLAPRAGSSPQQLLAELLDELAFESVSTSAERALAATIACHSAVRAGDTLDTRAMESILSQLAATPNPNTCPHGRPTALQLRRQQVESEFRRR